MSKKVLGIGLAIVGAALMFTGIGAPLGSIALGAGLGSISVATVIGAGLMVASNLLMGPAKPKMLRGGATPENRLHASLDPRDPRQIWIGRGNPKPQVRYQAFTGSNQKYLEQIVCVASHKVQAIEELWLDNEKAWSSSGGVQGRFAGFLTVTTRTEGTSGNGIAIDSVWTSSCTLTGCAYLHLKFLLVHDDGQGNNDSPFAGGVTSRMTIRGKGALTYDPRLDSTVDGGSGAHRADDQTTWAWNDNASRNLAIQSLFYELGWKINGKLAVGKGVPKDRLDLASYAVAANLCDETITKSAANGGGTEPRYRGDGSISEGDDPGAVRDNLCASMNAILRDSGGQLSLAVIHDDLATPVTPSGRSSFDENDVLGPIDWDQTPDLSSTFNIVRGSMIDPSDNALYQAVDFPEISLASPDGIDRIDTVSYPFVFSNGQAQRLAKQRLQRNQYQGRLSFTGGPAFWGVTLGDVFPFTHAAFGWSGKLFRCARHTMNRTGSVEIVAVEENAAIYQWDNDEAAAVQAGTPTVYDPLNDPFASGIRDASTMGIVIDPFPEVKIYADETGAVKTGQLPKNVSMTASKGTVDVTTVGTWTRTATSGVTCTIGAATGVLNITALASAEVKVPVSFTYQGVTRDAKVQIIRVDDPPTNSGSSGSSGTIANTSTLGNTTGTSYDATNAVSAVLTVTAGASGQVVCTAPLTFGRVSASDGETGAVGKWQWRVPAGVWADITTEVQESVTAVNDSVNPGNQHTGSISVSHTKTGLTSGSSYEFRFLWRRRDVVPAASNATRVSGTLSADGRG